MNDIWQISPTRNPEWTSKTLLRLPKYFAKDVILNFWFKQIAGPGVSSLSLRHFCMLGLVSLFNGMSTFMGYLKPKSSL